MTAPITRPFFAPTAAQAKHLEKLVFRRDVGVLREELRRLTTATPTKAAARPSKKAPSNCLLETAAGNGWVHETEVLLEHGLDPDGADDSGLRPLHLTANEPDGMSDLEGQCLTCAQMLLAAGADPNLRDGEGFTPLFLAAEKGDLFLSELLLDSGALVDRISEENGGTPLIAAVMWGHLNVARLLLARGANPLAQDENGMCAIDHAKQDGHMGLVRLLSSVEAIPNQLSQRRNTKIGGVSNPPMVEDAPEALASFYPAAVLADLGVGAGVLEEAQSVWLNATQYETGPLGLPGPAERAAQTPIQRLSTTPVVVYGGALEAEWGDGFWTDGLHFWVADSSLAQWRTDYVAQMSGAGTGNDLHPLMMALFHFCNEKPEAMWQEAAWQRFSRQYGSWHRPDRSWEEVQGSLARFTSGAFLARCHEQGWLDQDVVQFRKDGTVPDRQAFPCPPVLSLARADFSPVLLERLNLRLHEAAQFLSFRAFSATSIKVFQGCTPGFESDLWSLRTATIKSDRFDTSVPSSVPDFQKFQATLPPNSPRRACFEAGMSGTRHFEAEAMERKRVFANDQTQALLMAPPEKAPLAEVVPMRRRQP